MPRMFGCIPTLAELTSSTVGIMNSIDDHNVQDGDGNGGGDGAHNNTNNGSGDNDETATTTHRQRRIQKTCNLINCQQTSQGRGRTGTKTTKKDGPDTNNKRKTVASVLKLDPTTGALLPPVYRTVPRDCCPLLRHCWEQKWDRVVEIASREPHRALHRTHPYCRTALHLATFSNEPCPPDVARALLRSNRHMVLVQDKNWYTPLHIVAFFARPGGTALMSILCDTAIMVEQELRHGANSTTSATPRSYGTSPLFLAAKRNAPLPTLRTLLATRARTNWIAPTTGGEPYWWDVNTAPAPGGEEYSSPLEVLVRVHRYLRPELLLVPPTPSHGEDGKEGDGKPKLSRLAERMRQLALDRFELGTTYDDNGRNRRPSTQNIGDTVETETVVMGDPDGHESDTNWSVTDEYGNDRAPFSSFGHDEQQCLRLWEKCVELLVRHCPLLQVDKETDCPHGILHAATCCKVPIPSLVRVALILFPEQAFLRDERGMIPLHHVLCANHKYATPTLLGILLSSSPLEGDSLTSTSTIADAAAAATTSWSSTISPSMLQSTVLIPFPPTVNDDDRSDDGGGRNDGNGDDHNRTIHHHPSHNGKYQRHGPTPLAYALKKGLPMEPIIHGLLRADSHVSLHTLDPSTKLYPFGLAALNCEQQPPKMEDFPKDCVEMSDVSVAPDNDSNSNIANLDDKVGGCYAYKLDDVYTLLTAHPQVLAQYTTTTTIRTTGTTL